MFTELGWFFLSRLLLAGVLIFSGTYVFVGWIGADEPELYTAIMDYGSQVKFVLAQR